MYTIVNPIGAPADPNSTASNAYSGAMLGLGAAGGMGVSRIGNMVTNIVPVGSTSFSGYLRGVIRLAVHGAAALGLGMLNRGGGVTANNLVIGAQATTMATGVMGALNDFSGGTIGAAVAPYLEGSVVNPVGGYSSYSISSQTPTLTQLMRTGSQYIPARTGAFYGSAANAPVVTGAYADAAEYYG